MNSVCHFFGRRRFDVEDRSTNVGWLALVSLGESWHHNHHAFPRSAYHGLRRWEIDPSGLIISGCSGSVWPGTWCGSRPSASARGRWPAPSSQAGRAPAAAAASAALRIAAGCAETGEHQLGTVDAEARRAAACIQPTGIESAVDVFHRFRSGGTPCAGGARCGRRRALRRGRRRCAARARARPAAPAWRKRSAWRCPAARRGPPAGSRRRSRAGLGAAAPAGSRCAAGWPAGRGTCSNSGQSSGLVPPAGGSWCAPLARASLHEGTQL